jgi:hypothetical protein
VSYAFTTRLSYDNAAASDAGNKFGTGFGLQFYGKPLQAGIGTISTSLSALHDWGGVYPGSSVYANAGYYRNLGTIGSFGLNYTYSFADSEYGYNAQRISTDLYLRPSERWNSRVYLTYGLNDASMSAFGDFGCTIRPTWRLSVLGTYQKMPYFSYTDAEFALSKALGRQEARIIWSQSRKRFRVEFSALSF